jgi:hypothetical protein
LKALPRKELQLLVFETVARAAELPADLGRRYEINLRGLEQTLVANAIDNAAL